MNTVELFLKYPNIRSNPLCDGMWHNVVVQSLSQAVNYPWFYVMEYYDKEMEQQCVTVLVRVADTFYKAPLLSYGNLFTVVREVLTPVDIHILPVAIECLSTSYDLTDLTIRMFERGCKTSCYAAAPPPPPPPPPSGPSYYSGDGKRLEYSVKVNHNSKGPGLPDIDGQAFITRKSDCRLVTLFIYDSVIYYAVRIDKSCLVIACPSRDELLYILAHYFVVWRSVDFELIKDSRVIADALDKFRAFCFDSGVEVSITEVHLWSSQARQAGLLPAWLGHVAHKYEVYWRRVSVPK